MALLCRVVARDLQPFLVPAGPAGGALDPWAAQARAFLSNTTRHTLRKTIFCLHGTLVVGKKKQLRLYSPQFGRGAASVHDDPALGPQFSGLIRSAVSTVSASPCEHGMPEEPKLLLPPVAKNSRAATQNLRTRLQDLVSEK